MNEHWNEESVARYVDGEEHDDRHLHECPACSNRVIAAMRMKRAVRDAMPRFEVPQSPRDRVAGRVHSRRASWWMVAAAAVAVRIVG